MKCITQNVVAEWSFCTGKKYEDPFNEIQLDVVFADQDGEEKVVPAFWAGQGVWRVRFSPPTVGRFEYKTVCSDSSNVDLHGLKGQFEVAPYTGLNPLYRHGPLQVAPDRRRFQHLDGTPFFWLGDTFWMGLCKRLDWPVGFQTLALDRVKKGFSVIQIVAGLYPDIPPFDERGANEAGFPWETDYSRINPAYFDAADRRIEYLVSIGLMPCIVGCWGFFLGWTGIETMKKHWRYLIARWGAYPVVWCLAGEGTMPYYLSKTKEQDSAAQMAGWTEIGRYVRQVDPYRRLVTIHPSRCARETVNDVAVLDFDMLQTGHGGPNSIPNTIRLVRQERALEPVMPVLNGEVNYEGILHGNSDEIQRMAFWGCMLSGAAGHTYGANGIWQVNTRQEPFGPSPHGRSWGDTPWQDAYQLPGSSHLGLAKGLFERYEWWRFESHQEWVHPGANEEDYFAPYAAGIPGEVRVIYLYQPGQYEVRNIDPDVCYEAFFFDPRSGQEHQLGAVKPDNDGIWTVPNPPTMDDWVVVLESK